MQSRPTPTLEARPQSVCFVCGQENERGLRLRFESGGAGRARAEWTPETGFEGFQGVVHGGLVSTVLDEAMSKAVAWAGRQALTAELTVRFRERVMVGEKYVVEGWVTGVKKRVVETEAVLRGADGREHARGRAKFLALGGS